MNELHAPGLLAAVLSAPDRVDVESVDWQSVLPELRAQRLSGLVYSRLRMSPVWREVPPATQQALSHDFQALSIRAFTMETALADLLAGLRAAEVPVMLLKGAALGRLVYQNLAERPVSDFDLLIPADRVEDARHSLEQHGLRGQSLLWRTGWQRRYRAELAMAGETIAGQKLVVELHWSLVEVPYYIDRIPMTEVWQTSRALPELAGVSVPDPVTLLLHSCAHLAMHHSQEMELFWLLDVDRLVRWDRLDWDETIDRAQRWHLTLAVQCIVGATQARLNTPLPADVLQRLARVQPDPVEATLWGLGDGSPGRTRRRIRASWSGFTNRQRLTYAGWLALRSLLWLPEQANRKLSPPGKPATPESIASARPQLAGNSTKRKL